MSHKGYAFESEIEDFFLRLTGQTKQDPILKSDSQGLIRLNRTFRIPTSGAMESMKGDILTAIPWLPKQLKVECKIRRQKSKKEGRIFTLELEWIRKNNEEGLADNQIPLLTFAFKGETTGNRTWWLVRATDYEYLGKLPSMSYKTCPTGVLNKNQDKLKFVHSVLPNGADTVWTLSIDNELYYLLNQDKFYILMSAIRKEYEESITES